MKIRWTRPTESGLADRLNDLTFMATYARALNATVYMDWPGFQAKDIDVAHRRKDIMLENVKQFMNFPKEISFERGVACDRTFDLYIGGATSVEDFQRGHLSHMPFEEYRRLLIGVAKDFTFCDAINSFLATVPPNFVTFHIRRGDKVRTDQHDGTYIHADELNDLDRWTTGAIRHFRDIGYDTFFFCGDEDRKTEFFIEYTKALGLKTFTVPPMDKWQTTYYDLATMTKADYNVTSQRYSSFSSWPSKVAGITRDGAMGPNRNIFHTVFGLKDEGKV